MRAKCLFFTVQKLKIINTLNIFYRLSNFASFAMNIIYVTQKLKDLNP